MTSVTTTYTSLESVLLTILAVLVIVIFVGALYAFFYAIINYIFSKGDEEKNKNAWNSIRYMVWGIILTVGLLLFFPTLLKYLGVESYEVFSPRNILTRVGVVFDTLLEFGKDAAGSDAWFGGLPSPASNVRSDYSL